MGMVLGLLIFFGSGLSLLMAAAGFLSRPPDRPPLRQSALHALLGCLLFEFFLTHALGWTADMATHPAQTGVFLVIRCAKYSLGPLFFAAYLQLTTDDRLPVRGFLLHLLPQAVAWLLALAYLASALAGAAAFGALRRVMAICTAASLGHFLAYVAYALFAARTAGNRRALRGLLRVAALASTIAVLLALYQATGWKLLEMGSQALLALAAVAHFLVIQARPGSLERFGVESRKKRYQRSLLTGVDTDLLALRLRDLMEREQLYRDELLTLDSLAEKLALPRNGLSEFLNGVLHQPFNAYVNGYRVEEVKRLLRERPDRSILSHAYAAGFASKSVFYQAFKRVTAMTPQEFREGAGKPQDRAQRQPQG